MLNASLLAPSLSLAQITPVTPFLEQSLTASRTYTVPYTAGDATKLVVTLSTESPATGPAPRNPTATVTFGGAAMTRVARDVSSADFQISEIFYLDTPLAEAQELRIEWERAVNGVGVGIIGLKGARPGAPAVTSGLSTNNGLAATLSIAAPNTYVVATCVTNASTPGVKVTPTNPLQPFVVEGGNPDGWRDVGSAVALTAAGLIANSGNVVIDFIGAGNRPSTAAVGFEPDGGVSDPNAAVTPAAIFGDLRSLGASPTPQTATIMISNTGATRPLTLSGTFNGPNAAQYTFSPSAPLPASIPAGAAAEVGIIFTPLSAGGLFAATLDIVTNDPDGAGRTIILNAQTKIDPVISVPSLLSPFISIPYSVRPDFTERDIIVKNTGTSNSLVITATNLIFLGPNRTDYSVISVPDPLAPGAEGAIKIRLTIRPETDTYTATLTVVSNDTDSRPIVSLNAALNFQQAIPALVRTASSLANLGNVNDTFPTLVNPTGGNKLVVAVTTEFNGNGGSDVAANFATLTAPDTLIPLTLATNYKNSGGSQGVALLYLDNPPQEEGTIIVTFPGGAEATQLTNGCGTGIYVLSGAAPGGPVASDSQDGLLSTLNIPLTDTFIVGVATTNAGDPALTASSPLSQLIAGDNGSGLTSIAHTFIPTAGAFTLTFTGNANRPTLTAGAFKIGALPPPPTSFLVTSITRLNDGRVTLTWPSSSAANTRYTILTSTDLSTPLINWTMDTLGTFSGDAVSTTKTTTAAYSEPRRFFRIQETITPP